MGALTERPPSSLAEYAEEELRRAGLLDTGSDYDGWLGRCVLDLMAMFVSQGHTGESAARVLGLLDRLLQFKPLSPLTYAEDEWVDRTALNEGQPLWQNRRDPTVFSDNQGATWWSLDDRQGVRPDDPR